jgi:uncharacterized protein
VIAYVDTSSLLKLLRADLEHGRRRSTRTVPTVRTRGARLTAAQHRAAKGELVALVEELTIVEITEDLIVDAAEMAEQEALRGYDAVHLAAALTVEADLITSANVALCDMAGRRGLAVANPLDA